MQTKGEFIYEQNIEKSIKAIAVKQVLGHIDEDPDKSLPKPLNQLEKFDQSGGRSLC